MKIKIILASFKTPFVSLFVIALLLGMIGPRAFARDHVPFTSVLNTEFDSSVAFPVASVHVVGGGRTSHMGWTSIETTDQTVNLLTGVGVATYRFVAANGDYLDIFFDELFIAAPGGYTFSGTWSVLGGSGRFTGASGSGDTWGTVTFQSETTGIGHFEMQGAISTVGKSK